MEDLKDELYTLGCALGEKHQLDKNEFYIVRENKLKNIASTYDKKELFNICFMNGMKDIDIDDKIVMIFDIERYNIKEFEHNMNRKGLIGNEGNVADFKNIIFDKIKELLLKGLEKLKELIKEKLEEFIQNASKELGKLIKEKGIELLESIIDKIRSGKKPDEITVKYEGEKMCLTDIIDEDEIDNIEDLADDVNKMYKTTYRQINKEVKEIKDENKINDENNSNDEVKDDKQKKNKQDNDKQDKSNKQDKQDNKETELEEVKINKVDIDKKKKQEAKELHLKKCLCCYF